MDKYRCLYGLDTSEETMDVTDARRVKDIFTEPQFFVDGVGNTIQGGLGNCWLLSALATVGTMKGLIQKICVAVIMVPASISDLRAHEIAWRSATSRSGCTDSSFTWTRDGLMWSLMS